MVDCVEKGGDLLFLYFRVLKYLIDAAVGVGAEGDGVKKHVLDFLD